MFVVALTDVNPCGEGLEHVARELGLALYDLNMAVNAGLPAVVLSSATAAEAERAVSSIRAAGCQAISLDRTTMVTSDRMTALEDFRFEPDALVSGSSAPTKLPYDDIAALLRASHHSTRQVRVHQQEDPRLRNAAVVAARRTVATEETNEQVLYVFRRSGAAPWILREKGAEYTGLGRSLRPTSLENFAATVQHLRGAAPLAHYDERLMRRAHVRGVLDDAVATDIRAYLLAAHWAGGTRRESYPAKRTDPPRSSIPSTRATYLDSSKTSESMQGILTFWANIPRGVGKAVGLFLLFLGLTVVLKMAVRDTQRDSHAVQCKKLIDVINTANVAILKRFESASENDEPLGDQELLEIDKAIQSGKATITEVPLADAQLDELRRKYLSSIDGIWVAVQSLAAATKREDIPVMKAGLLEMKKVSATERDAIAEISRSCR
jgi:hypothetical protein